MIGNLYNMARTLIPSDEVYLSKFLSNSENDVGQLIPAYGEQYLIDASFQPIESSIIEHLGLELDKTYRVLYTNELIQNIEDNTSSDIVYFNGVGYQCLKKSDWLSYNGWNGVVCVRLWFG